MQSQRRFEKKQLKPVVKGLVRYDKEQGIFVFLLMTTQNKLQNLSKPILEKESNH